MTPKTLAEIAHYIDGEIVGDDALLIRGFNGIKEAQPGDLTFLSDVKYLDLLQTTQASAIITPQVMVVPGKSIIRTTHPSIAFSKIVSWLTQTTYKPIQGIDPKAVIAASAKLSSNVAVGPYAVIEDDVVVKEGTRIEANAFIGQGTTIGQQCIISPHVVIKQFSVIGDRVVIHSGSVIGSDGFGFETTKEGVHQKIPQVGTVVIEDDVEIGSCVTIDRARFNKTIIGRGTKIDNLVQVAHNVVIGENCLIVAQVGIAGSTIIGKNVILAGQSGVIGHVKLGDNSIVTSRAGVTKSIPANSIVLGFPAKPHIEAKRLQAHFNQLPSYAKTIIDLKNRLAELEAKINSK